MKKTLFMLLFASILFAGCSFLKSLTAPSPAGSGEAAAPEGLVLTPEKTEFSLEWGTPTEIPIEGSWNNGQKYPVQFARASDTPDWLVTDLQPAILQPPGKAVLKITAALGEAELGEYTLVLEASAYSMNQPVKIEFKLNIVRQSGQFVPVLAAPVTVECRNICGKVADGRVTFYDLLREKNQTCSDRTDLPAAQKIGGSFSLSSNGFGYGRTCTVAAVFGSDGGVSVVNLGLPGAALKRGEVLLTSRPAQTCWFSQDNTVALVISGTSVTPYDVRNGTPLGLGCSIYGELTSASLDGTKLTAEASRPCTWEIK